MLPLIGAARLHHFGTTCNVLIRYRLGRLSTIGCQEPGRTGAGYAWSMERVNQSRSRNRSPASGGLTPRRLDAETYEQRVTSGFVWHEFFEQLRPAHASAPHGLLQ